MAVVHFILSIPDLMLSTINLQISDKESNMEIRG